MNVVSNSSPLHYLILIDAIQVLPNLYGKVFIPSVVHQELSAGNAPQTVRRWLASPREWLCVLDNPKSAPRTDIHEGEAAVIALAQALFTPFVLLDDLAARRCAQKEGLEVIGTLGILRDAATLDLLDLRRALTSLTLQRCFGSS